ncbi:two pore domain potassium channel family protein [Xylanibacillus composti]|uniref:Potassium channel domain-containing protein n=1 Tax=Xylanibacillus composti TaxID=1572762 RepID=A0A8J4M4F0_9BACL|nr:potassium channel family protein [Xylanibacillus composti]MDT9725723.1 two pore domain potassium channel family protein [Xylanibacillus composti]GIQ71137.1 hypothetical protein XYCOK13_39610 [Xylanibacillus composti]
MGSFLRSVYNLGRRTKHAFSTEKVFVVLLFMLALFYCIGVIFYITVEKTSFVNAVYHCAMLITTVGDSKFTPTTVAGKLFTAGYSLLTTVLFVGFITGLAQAIIIQEHQKEKNQQ